MKDCTSNVHVMRMLQEVIARGHDPASCTWSTAAEVMLLVTQSPGTWVDLQAHGLLLAKVFQVSVTILTRPEFVASHNAEWDILKR